MIGERVALRDDGGRVVATYLHDQRLGRPCADMLDAEPGVPLERVVAVIVERLPGWVVAGAEVDVGEALVAAGARERRRAIVLHRGLTRPDASQGATSRPAPAGIEIVPLAHSATRLLPAFLAAFPPGHPDRAPESSDADELADLQGVLDGTEVGPLLPTSRVAVNAAGDPVGAVTLNDRRGTPPLAGPWISVCFRDPRASPRGTGAALIQCALAALREAGAPAAGLAVTAGNPAERVYKALGFVQVTSGVTVIVPPLDSIPEV